MTASPAKTVAAPAPERSRTLVITALGLTQIMAWGSSYYLIAVLSQPIAADTGWPLAGIVGGLSLGLLAAGLIARRVGRTIQAHGGRPVLAGSALLLAAGLAGLGLAPNLPLYLLAWIVLGLGMGAGLYDAAFSTLGRLYGGEARRAITTLTLWGGFASTLCWPLSAFLVAQLGWRGACLAYAAVQVAVSLPLLLLALPAARETAPVSPVRPGPAPAPDVETRADWSLFLLLATVMTLGSAVMSVVSVHLLTMLQAGRGLDLAAAVAFGALIGPSQVGARVVEMAAGRHYHPIWTLVASVSLVALGLVLLAFGGPALAAALVAYGAGNGLSSIARGSLPLALFGPGRYPVWMGRVATPTLLAGALAPVIGGLALDALGPARTLAALAAAALLNVALVLVLWRRAAP